MRTATKLTNKMLLALKGDNKLTNSVIDDIIDYSKDGIERIHYIENILQHGCVSRTVGALIYYSDTTEFYNKFKEEIFNLADEQAQDFGYKSALELFASLNGAKDVNSIEQEENLKAWFGFEETVRMIANQLNLDI